MKKIFSLLLVAVLLMGLSVSALAAEDPTDVVVEVMEEDVDPFTGDLGGGDAALRLKYGFIWINADGTFEYQVDAENEAVKKAIEGKYPLVDKCILTFDSLYGGWVGRYMNIVILPEGAKDPHYESNFLLVTDMEGKTEGTILFKGEGCEDMALRVHLGRLQLSDSGEYTYVNYPFLDCVQIMRKNMVREDRYPAVAGSGEYHIVVRTTGENDKPVIKNVTINLKPGEDFTSGDMMEKATRGDGPVSTHKFGWVLGNKPEHAKYGNFTAYEDGSFTYEFTAVREATETLTETFVYSYTDIDGETAEGVLTINILPESAT